MKKTLPLLLLTSLILASCNSTHEYISYKEYIEMVKNSSEDQKDIFVITASTCGTCQEIVPLIEKYKTTIEDEKLNIHLLTVDRKTNAVNGLYPFKDETMGYLSGDAANDCLKQLDNRIIEFTLANPNYPYLTRMLEGNYSYVSTPLAIFYENGIEVKFLNTYTSVLEISDKNERYEQFVSLMQYPETNPTWNKQFDLSYYEKQLG